MANVFDLLPDVVLTIMGFLSLTKTKWLSDSFAAAAALFNVDEGQLYREVEQFIQEHWEEQFTALDVHSRGLQYFAGEAESRRSNALLLDAACRLKGAQLSVWGIEKRRCFLYGHHGPMYTATVSRGQFIALIGTPLIPWYRRVARVAEPSTSYKAEEEPTLPIKFDRNEVVPEEPSGPSEAEVPYMERDEDMEVEPELRGPAEHQPESNAAPADNSSQRVQWLEELAARYREMLRPRTEANLNAKRVPRRRAAKKQPDFRPADISALPAHMDAELVAPTTPPYIYSVALVNNTGLILVSAFCGTCGHHLIVPPEVGPAGVKAFITAHKKERCAGASRTTMRQRHSEVSRLDGLMRNTSHILVPDMQQVEAPAEVEVQPSVVRRKRRHDTEQARRADICAAYLKRFRASEPKLMAEIAREHELQLP
uniref:Uncharacterized protein n=1 Tax=Parascaris univalens TaxID=6257 RepID=A0A915A1U7_PARUN